jgi:large subunit ribosomal protein L25
MSDIPSNIEVDVSHLEVGHHVNAGDIALPDGVKLLSSPDATLFSMQVLKAVSLEPELAEEPVEGEAPAEEPETEAGATEEDNG